MTYDDLIAAAPNANLAAFLHAIRLGEGTSDEDGYRRMVGGELFDSFDRHPFDGTGRELVYLPKYKVHSSASGAYQIIRPTWKNLQKLFGFDDFLPHTQDLAAIGLIAGRRALNDVMEGRIEAAIEVCRLEWASLPGSPYGQRTEGMDAVLAEYGKYGGKLA